MPAINTLLTPADVQLSLAKNFKVARLNKNHTQGTASSLTGVPESTLKKFENSGQISLRQFLSLCHVYGDLSVTKQIFTNGKSISMDELLKAESSATKRQRGRT